MTQKKTNKKTVKREEGNKRSGLDGDDEDLSLGMALSVEMGRRRKVGWCEEEGLGQTDGRMREGRRPRGKEKMRKGRGTTQNEKSNSND